MTDEVREALEELVDLALRDAAAREVYKRRDVVLAALESEEVVAEATAPMWRLGIRDPWKLTCYFPATTFDGGNEMRVRVRILAVKEGEE